MIKLFSKINVFTYTVVRRCCGRFQINSVLRSVLFKGVRLSQRLSGILTLFIRGLNMKSIKRTLAESPKREEMKPIEQETWMINGQMEKNVLHEDYLRSFFTSADPSCLQRKIERSVFFFSYWMCSNVYDFQKIDLKMMIMIVTL